MMYDVIVIGAGIAGLTSAIYARRAAKTVLIIEKETFGGQITLSHRVENYPGISSISGIDLANTLVMQATELGAEVEIDEVRSVAKAEDGFFDVTTEYGSFRSKSVIIATGLKHRKLEAEGVERFDGNGISYCAVCDGAFYRDRDVAVIGGGNSALQEAIYLSEICKKVYLVHRRDSYRAESAVVERMMGRENIVRVENSVVEAVNGDERINGITVKNVISGEKRNIIVAGVFSALGHIPNNAAFANIIELDSTGFVDANESCLTDMVGVFVAGDCRKKEVRQLTTASADGAVAAVAAAKYVESL